ncbi:hypothetical protein M3Y97_00752400 [Aphelenchoides bicaudatus]|nr:hypothetical protein M3Y97_00752400 [Aphelenchoides bicaudatus]
MQAIDDLFDWESLYHYLEIGQACFLLCVLVVQYNVINVFLGLGVALGFVIYETIITNEVDVDTSRSSCLSTERYPDLMTFIWIFAGLTYITGLLFFIWLYRKNKYLITHPSDFSLTTRHQLYENLSTNGLVAPCISLYALVLLFGIPLVCWCQIYLLNNGRDGNDFVVSTVHQLLLMSCDVYSFSFTLFAMFRFKPLNKHVRNDLRHLFCIKAETRPGIILPTGEDKTNLYFEHLKETWNQSFRDHSFRERKISRF